MGDVYLLVVLRVTADGRKRRLVREVAVCWSCKLRERGPTVINAAKEVALLGPGAAGLV